MKLNSILEAIGRTPLVKLNRVGSGLSCNLWGKCEFLNPGGSLKDRVGFAMVDAAEKEGRIKPGDTLIEPSSGNTGIGIALAGAVKGYRVIITLPDKMSHEKQVVLEALGAEIIRTPSAAAFDSPESHISVAKRLQTEIPNAHILDQYGNPNNPLIHYNTTAQEILDDLENKVDMVVLGAGTCGSITGVAKRIKEVNPNCIVVGADPIGSILGGGNYVALYKVEGIGYDFFPDVLDKSVIDEWIKTEDRSSFLLARRLIKEEGLLVGGSSGSALSAALQAAARLPKDANCVIVFPDGVRNYLSKFIDSKWMRENGFFESPPIQGIVDDILNRQQSSYPLVCADDMKSVQQVIKIMREKNISQLPVTSGGILVGILSESDILEFVGSGGDSVHTRASKCMNRQVPVVGRTTPISTLQETLRINNAAVVVDDNNRPLTIMTKIDLLDYISQI